jgi:glycosyltransferase involved in cell wall biosynthesis
MSRVRVAFPLLGRGGWTAGYVYLKNTLRLICTRLSDEIEPWVFLSPAEHKKYGTELSPLVEGRLIVDPAIAIAGRGKSLVRALVTGKDKALEDLLLAKNVDVAFEHASFYGARFAIPVVAWMPDFQHRRMPEMFGRLNWWRRDLGFRMQIRARRTLMLSSETAREDLEQFYPEAKGRGHVVRFAIDLDIGAHLRRSDEMRAAYGLPERFFFLPNQFWRHKNHSLIVAALKLLKARGHLDALPPVILSGHNTDPRNPTYFDDLMRTATAAGVAGHFRHLGLIPYNHVLSLSAACHTQMNPSHFEGWSTPIEEAKAFATPLILSDIPIHREQAPDARFFNSTSPEAAAAALLDCARAQPCPRAPALALQAAQDVRLAEHARALLATVKAAACGAPHAHRRR